MEQTVNSTTTSYKQQNNSMLQIDPRTPNKTSVK